MSFTLLRLVTLGAVLSTSIPSFAVGVGNGGVSVVCRDDNDRINSAELLDIFEGKVRYSKRYDNNLDAETKVELAQLKLAKHPGFLEAFQEELSNVRAILKYVPVGTVLTPTNDAFPTILKKGCEFEQVANYTDDGDLLVSEEIHHEFREVDKAALLVHETVYALFRKAGAKDSRQARKLTAELLAQNADQKVIDQIIKVSFREDGTCGLKGSVEERMKDCGEVKGNFALVSRTKEGYEVYKDLQSGLIWSDRLSNEVNHHGADKICKVSLKETAGITGTTWRLPSIEEYKDADINGIREALPNIWSWFWSSSMHRNYSYVATLFNGVNGYTGNVSRNSDSDYVASVRCVAR